MTEGTELPNQEKIRILWEKKTYKYLGILEVDTIKHVEMKEKEYLMRWRKLPKTKLHSRNLTKRITTWAVQFIRYLWPFLKWTRRELQQMDQETRKLMIMHEALHPRDDVDRLCVSRKEGGRGLASIEDSITAFMQWLEDYMKKLGERQITVTRNNSDNTSINRTKITRKQKWKEKQL